MKLKILGLSLVSAALILVGYQKYSEYQALRSINTFEECVTAKGSIVQYSYPATCVTKIGKKYVENVKPTLTHINEMFLTQFNYLVGSKTYPLRFKREPDYEIIDLDICGQIYIGSSQSAAIFNYYPILHKLSLLAVGSKINDSEQLANGLVVPISMIKMPNSTINSIDWVVINDVSNGDTDHRSSTRTYYWRDTIRTILMSFRDHARCEETHNEILSTFKFLDVGQSL